MSTPQKQRNSKFCLSESKSGEEKIAETIHGNSRIALVATPTLYFLSFPNSWSQPAHNYSSPSTNQTPHATTVTKVNPCATSPAVLTPALLLLVLNTWLKPIVVEFSHRSVIGSASSSVATRVTSAHYSSTTPKLVSHQSLHLLTHTSRDERSTHVIQTRPMQRHLNNLNSDIMPWFQPCPLCSIHWQRHLPEAKAPRVRVPTWSCNLENTRHRV